MSCIGDRIAGINKDAECYRQGCPGCEKCWVYCDPPCENCPTATLRDPEVGDFVVVYRKFCGITFKHNWNPAMDEAIGRLAYIASGNKLDGYKLKFTTTNKEVLDSFIYPAESMKLALPQDIKTDQMLKTDENSAL